MKMKVQKIDSMKVILLFLLLYGGMNFSFSIVNGAEKERRQELLVTTEFSEQHQDIVVGRLSIVTRLNLQEVRNPSTLPNCEVLNRVEAGKAATYLSFCQHIDPSRGPTEIIYPFHFFL